MGAEALINAGGWGGINADALYFASTSAPYAEKSNAAVVAESSYEPMMIAAGGEVSLEAFRAEHVRLRGEPDAVEAFASWMGRTMVQAFDGRP